MRTQLAGPGVGGRRKSRWQVPWPLALSSCFCRLRLPSALASCLFVLFFSSCLSYEQVELQDITNVQVDQLDLKGIAVRIDARINNPNGYKIHLLDPDVDLFINGKFIGKGILDTALTLQKRSTQIYFHPYPRGSGTRVVAGLVAFRYAQFQKRETGREGHRCGQGVLGAETVSVRIGRGGGVLMPERMHPFHRF